ncbi:MAG: hypothetical protein AAFQ98_18225 [Bacteroidota bacterium]
MSDWKDEILDSVHGMERAQPPAELYSQIQHRLHEEATPQKPATWWAVAATVTLLLVGNIVGITQYQQRETTPTQDTGYPTMISDFNLYGE